MIAPETFTSSNSVKPSISTLPLKSAAPVKVDTPDTFKLSNSVCPSISTLPLKSAAPVKVERPDTLIFLVSISSPSVLPETYKAPPT